MKARVTNPVNVTQISKTIRLFLIIVCYALNTEFSFGTERLNKLLDCVVKLTEGLKSNSTAAEEYETWAEKKGLNI